MYTGTGNSKPPPPEWKPDLEGEVERMAAWCSLPVHARSNFKKQQAARAKYVELYSKAAAAGVATKRQLTYIERGGAFRVGSKDAMEERKARESKQANDAKSAKTLAFQLEHIRGCSEPGCPLAHPAQHASFTPLLCLFEHDHIDPEEKVDCVTKLTGQLRQDELLKTRVLCLWHHHLRTREQLGHGQIQNPVIHPLAAYKAEVQCQHPCHASMAHASVVVDLQSPSALAFLEVSHVNLGSTVQRTSSGTMKAGLMLQHLQSVPPTAVVHCSFCHALYTLCERATLRTAPLVVHQLGQLRLQYPAFVQHFEQMTAGFDWDAERVRQSDLLRRAALRRKKRKREIDK